jgi:GNAT superfamily N-acetyltransferase
LEEVEVVPVTQRREWSSFIDLPYFLYRADPYWVPPLRIAQKELLDTRKHPFYGHAEMQCFLALRGGQPVGRIAAINDRNYSAFHGEDAGFFGFFESIDSQPVATALFGAARSWLVDRGVKIIRGPMNPSTNYECGLLVDGFESCPRIMMTYNPPWYARLIEGAGLRKEKDLLAYYLTVDAATDGKSMRVAERSLASSGLKIRSIRMDRFWTEVENIWEVYTSAWSRNWGFAPMSRDEFLHTAKEMKPIVNPDFLLVGEVDGRMVGFALALPDINQAFKHAGGRLFPLGLFKILYHKRFIHTMRVLLLGVMKQYQTAGVAAGFYAALIRNGRKAGVRDGELSWVLEDNILMNRSAEALGASRYKTYRIYQWN